MLKSFLSGLCALLLLISPANNWASVDFDGIDDALNCGSGSSIDQLITPTVSAWIYYSDDGADASQVIYNKSTFLRIFYISDNDGALNNALVFQFQFTSTTAVKYVSVTNAISANTWTHILATYDHTRGNDQRVDLFINGVETTYSTTDEGSGTLDQDDSAGTANIGSRSTSTVFDGQIDEVAIWSVVLTADEITKLAKSKVKGMPLQIRPASLAAYWSLDEQSDGTSGDADSFFDKTANANTCTGNNGADNLGLTAKAEEVLSYP